MFHPAIQLNIVSGSFSDSRTALNSRKSKQSENIGKKKIALAGKISDRTFNWNSRDVLRIDRSIDLFVETNFN